MKMNIGFLTLVKREIVRFTCVFTQTIFPPVMSSFLYIFIFGFSLGSRIETVQGVPYLTFLIPGLMMMYIIEGSYANTSSSLFISRWANNIEELLVTPLSYLEMVAAILIGGLARSLVVTSGVYLVSLCFVQSVPVHPIWTFFFIIFVSLTFSSVGMIVALFADDVVIHDPVGKPPVTDRTTVREFFHNVVTHVYDAKLDGPVRGSEGHSAAFSFELYVEWPNGSKQIVRAVDVMTFNDAGKIVLMQAYHGPGDMVDA